MVVSRARILGLATFVVAGAVLATAPFTSAKTQFVSQVEVQEEEGLTRVVLRGASDPVYTAFMMSDPPRLMVDLPEVRFDGPSGPIQVHNGLVGEILLDVINEEESAPAVARVSIGLLRNADYEVVPEGNEVIVEIRADENVPARIAPEPELSEPVVRAAAEEETPAPPAAASPAPARSVPAKPSSGRSRVVKVVPRPDGVEVHAEGPVDNVDSFVVHKPERLVVDLWGTENAEKRSRISMDGELIQGVRIGQHPDRVRVVFDLSGTLGDHTIEPMRDGVRIRLVASGGSLPDPEPLEEVPAAADSAPVERPEQARTPEPETIAEDDEPRVAPTPSGQARVTSIHFESYDELDRVVVSLTRTVQPIVVAPDDRTVIVDLPGSVIAPEVERRIDTREFHGPVQMLSAFKTPDIDEEQVRVVLKRVGTATPNVRWEGNQLMIELARFGTSGPAMDSPGAGSPSDEASSAGAPPAAIPGSGSSRSSIDPVAYGDDDETYAGPADPASIDILAEGGFTEEKEYQGRRISLDFKDADIGNILRLIADVSDLNIIAGEEVSGTVTVRLVEVPWDQALDVILMTKGLGFNRIGKVLRIAPVEVLKQEEEQRLQERRARERLEDLVVKLQPVSYADVKDLEKLVKKLLSPRGTVNIDRRTNTLIIKDIPSVINEATALVKAVDTQTPQVLIEAKIVEANLSFSRSLGAVFGIGYNPVGTGGRQWQGGAPDFRLGDGANSTLPALGGLPQATNFIVANPVAAATGALTLGLLGLDDHVQLDLQLQAAEANTKAKVISSPRVVTLDNREAKILQGTAIRFDASDGDSVSTSFVDAVLELRVTPHITADRTIIMQIMVSRNAPRTDNATGEDTGINKNEAETELLVFDGQTAVLGGIYVVEKSNSSSKVPFLADIPLLGTAFRNGILADERRELLIFVTPRIVRGMTPAS